MNGKQLKNSILQLAIQGKLVPQDPNDEPASALLQRIRAEKEQLVKEKKLKKKDLVTTPITDEEKPFEIPESWEWCRFEDIADKIFAGGDKPKDFSLIKDDNHSVPVIANGVNNDGILGYTNKATAKANTITVAGRGTIGFTLYRTYDYCPIVRLIVMEPSKYVYPPYLVHVMSTLDTKSLGTSIPQLTVPMLKPKVLPLPPLSEQQRIVAKIEELMPLVEEYDKAQTKLDDLNRKLPEALKKSILQEAIMGKLVPQDPNDEPASVLLQRIRAEKEQLVKEGKLKKKDLVTTPISDEEKPFEIPESWEWCRLGDVGIFERGNGIKRDETRTEGYPCVRYGEMYTAYRKNPTFEKTISFTTEEVFKKCRKAHKGDLFMALTGENKKDIALAAQYVGDDEIAVGGDLCHFTVLGAYALYFVYLINSPYYSGKKELLATGDIIIHISADKLASIPIPLPPLAEQRRIVAKIEELLGVLD